MSCHPFDSERDRKHAKTQYLFIIISFKYETMQGFIPKQKKEKQLFSKKIGTQNCFVLLFTESLIFQKSYPKLVLDKDATISNHLLHIHPSSSNIGWSVCCGQKVVFFCVCVCVFLSASL